MINFILPPDVPEELRELFEKAVRFRGQAWQEEVLTGTAFLDAEIPHHLEWLIDYAGAQQVESFPQYMAYARRALTAAVKKEHRAYIAADVLYWLRAQGIVTEDETYMDAASTLKRYVLEAIATRAHTQLEVLYFTPLIFNALGSLNIRTEIDRAQALVNRLVDLLFTGLDTDEEPDTLDQRLQLFMRVLTEFAPAMADEPAAWRFLLPHLRMTLHATVPGFTEWDSTAAQSSRVDLLLESQNKLLMLYEKLKE